MGSDRYEIMEQELDFKVQKMVDSLEDETVDHIISTNFKGILESLIEEYEGDDLKQKVEEIHSKDLVAEFIVHRLMFKSF